MNRSSQIKSNTSNVALDKLDLKTNTKRIDKVPQTSPKRRKRFKTGGNYIYDFSSTHIGITEPMVHTEHNGAVNVTSSKNNMRPPLLPYEKRKGTSANTNHMSSKVMEEGRFMNSDASITLLSPTNDNSEKFKLDTKECNMTATHRSRFDTGSSILDGSEILKSLSGENSDELDLLRKSIDSQHDMVTPPQIERKTAVAATTTPTTSIGKENCTNDTQNLNTSNDNSNNTTIDNDCSEEGEEEDDFDNDDDISLDPEEYLQSDGDGNDFDDSDVTDDYFGESMISLAAIGGSSTTPNSAHSKKKYYSPKQLRKGQQSPLNNQQFFMSSTSIRENELEDDGDIHDTPKNGSSSLETSELDFRRMSLFSSASNSREMELQEDGDTDKRVSPSMITSASSLLQGLAISEDDEESDYE